MARGVGGIDPVQGLVPESLAVVVALVTQLGDVWFLSVVLAGAWWAFPDEREDVATLVGIALSAFATVILLKYTIALPRPGAGLVDPGSLSGVYGLVYRATGTASGYGFPSGHATMTAAVYPGLAAILPVATRRVRFGVAAALVATVSFTRIALGVHYLVDVVAGIALGVAVLTAGWTLVDRLPLDRPTGAFSLAVLAGGLALAASGLALDAVALLGGSLALLAVRVATRERRASGSGA